MTELQRRRKPLPEWVKYTVLARQRATCRDCGWPLERDGEGKVEYDHRPPLADRQWIASIKDFWPCQHHPDFVHALCPGCHDRRTNGPGGEKRITTAGSDTHRRAKTRSIHQTLVRHQARMQAKGWQPPETLPPDRKVLVRKVGGKVVAWKELRPSQRRKTR